MRDIDVRNAAKAACIVGGGIAVIGVIILSWPLLVAFGGIILSLLLMMAPLILVAVATFAVYRYLQKRH